MTGLDTLAETRGHVAALADLAATVGEIIQAGIAAGVVNEGREKSPGRHATFRVVWRPSSLVETQARAELDIRAWDGSPYPIPVRAYWPLDYLNAVAPGSVSDVEFSARYLSDTPGILSATPEQVDALVAGHAHAVAVNDYLTRLNRVLLPAIRALDPGRNVPAGKRIGWSDLDRHEALPGLPWATLLAYDTDEFVARADETTGGLSITWERDRGGKLLGRFAGMVFFQIGARDGTPGVWLSGYLPNAPKRPARYDDIHAAKVAAAALLREFFARTRPHTV